MCLQFNCTRDVKSIQVQEGGRGAGASELQQTVHIVAEHLYASQASGHARSSAAAAAHRTRSEGKAPQPMSISRPIHPGPCYGVVVACGRKLAFVAAEVDGSLPLGALWQEHTGKNSAATLSIEMKRDDLLAILTSTHWPTFSDSFPPQIVAEASECIMQLGSSATGSTADLCADRGVCLASVGVVARVFGAIAVQLESQATAAAPGPAGAEAPAIARARAAIAAVGERVRVCSRGVATGAGGASAAGTASAAALLWANPACSGLHRLESFAEWPLTAPTPFELAEAGLVADPTPDMPTRLRYFAPQKGSAAFVTPSKGTTKAIGGVLATKKLFDGSIQNVPLATAVNALPCEEHRPPSYSSDCGDGRAGDDERLEIVTSSKAQGWVLTRATGDDTVVLWSVFARMVMVSSLDCRGVAMLAEEEEDEVDDDDDDNDDESDGDADLTGGAAIDGPLLGLHLVADSTPLSAVAVAAVFGSDPELIGPVVRFTVLEPDMGAYTATNAGASAAGGNGSGPSGAAVSPSSSSGAAGFVAAARGSGNGAGTLNRSINAGVGAAPPAWQLRCGICQDLPAAPVFPNRCAFANHLKFAHTDVFNSPGYMVFEEPRYLGDAEIPLFAVAGTVYSDDGPNATLFAVGVDDNGFPSVAAASLECVLATLRSDPDEEPIESLPEVAWRVCSLDFNPTPLHATSQFGGSSGGGRASDDVSTAERVFSAISKSWSLGQGCKVLSLPAGVPGDIAVLSAAGTHLCVIEFHEQFSNETLEPPLDFGGYSDDYDDEEDGETYHEAASVLVDVLLPVAVVSMDCDTSDAALALLDKDGLLTMIPLDPAPPTVPDRDTEECQPADSTSPVSLSEAVAAAAAAGGRVAEAEALVGSRPATSSTEPQPTVSDARAATPSSSSSIGMCDLATMLATKKALTTSRLDLISARSFNYSGIMRISEPKTSPRQNSLVFRPDVEVSMEPRDSIMLEVSLPSPQFVTKIRCEADFANGRYPTGLAVAVAYTVPGGSPGEKCWGSPMVQCEQQTFSGSKVKMVSFSDPNLCLNPAQCIQLHVRWPRPASVREPALILEVIRVTLYGSEVPINYRVMLAQGAPGIAPSTSAPALFSMPPSARAAGIQASAAAGGSSVLGTQSFPRASIYDPLQWAGLCRRLLRTIEAPGTSLAESNAALELLHFAVVDRPAASFSAAIVDQCAFGRLIRLGVLLRDHPNSTIAFKFIKALLGCGRRPCEPILAACLTLLPEVASTCVSATRMHEFFEVLRRAAAKASPRARSAAVAACCTEVQRCRSLYSRSIVSQRGEPTASHSTHGLVLESGWFRLPADMGGMDVDTGVPTMFGQSCPLELRSIRAGPGRVTIRPPPSFLTPLLEQVHELTFAGRSAQVVWELRLPSMPTHVGLAIGGGTTANAINVRLSSGNENMLGAERLLLEVRLEPGQSQTRITLSEACCTTHLHLEFEEVVQEGENTAKPGSSEASTGDTTTSGHAASSNNHGSKVKDVSFVVYGHPEIESAETSLSRAFLIRRWYNLVAVHTEAEAELARCQDTLRTLLSVRRAAPTHLTSLWSSDRDARKVEELFRACRRSHAQAFCSRWSLQRLAEQNLQSGALGTVPVLKPVDCVGDRCKNLIELASAAVAEFAMLPTGPNPQDLLRLVDFIRFEDALKLFRELCVGQPVSLKTPVQTMIERCNFGQRGWARFVIEGMRTFFGGGKQSIEAYTLLKGIATRRLESTAPSWDNPLLLELIRGVGVPFALDDAGHDVKLLEWCLRLYLELTPEQRAVDSADSDQTKSNESNHRRKSSKKLNASSAAAHDDGFQIGIQSDIDQPVYFRLKQTTKLGQLFSHYHSMKQLCLSMVEFWYDGVVIGPNQTAASIGIPNKGAIQVRQKRSKQLPSDGRADAVGSFAQSKGSGSKDAASNGNNSNNAAASTIIVRLDTSSLDEDDEESNGPPDDAHEGVISSNDLDGGSSSTSSTSSLISTTTLESVSKELTVCWVLRRYGALFGLPSVEVAAMYKGARVHGYQTLASLEFASGDTLTLVPAMEVDPACPFLVVACRAYANDPPSNDLCVRISRSSPLCILREVYCAHESIRRSHVVHPEEMRMTSIDDRKIEGCETPASMRLLDMVVVVMHRVYGDPLGDVVATLDSEGDEGRGSNCESGNCVVIAPTKAGTSSSSPLAQGTTAGLTGDDLAAGTHVTSSSTTAAVAAGGGGAVVKALLSGQHGASSPSLSKSRRSSINPEDKGAEALSMAIAIRAKENELDHVQRKIATLAVSQKTLAAKCMQMLAELDSEDSAGKDDVVPGSTTQSVATSTASTSPLATVTSDTRSFLASQPASLSTEALVAELNDAESILGTIDAQLKQQRSRADALVAHLNEAVSLLAEESGGARVVRDASATDAAVGSSAANVSARISQPPLAAAVESATATTDVAADIELVNSGEEFFVPAQLFGLLCHRAVSDPIRKAAFQLLGQTLWAISGTAGLTSLCGVLNHPQIDLFLNRLSPFDNESFQETISAVLHKISSRVRAIHASPPHGAMAACVIDPHPLARFYRMLCDRLDVTLRLPLHALEPHHIPRVTFLLELMIATGEDGAVTSGEGVAVLAMGFLPAAVVRRLFTFVANMWSLIPARGTLVPLLLQIPRLVDCNVVAPATDGASRAKTTKTRFSAAAPSTPGEAAAQKSKSKSKPSQRRLSRTTSLPVRRLSRTSSRFGLELQDSLTNSDDLWVVVRAVADAGDTKSVKLLCSLIDHMLERPSSAQTTRRRLLEVIKSLTISQAPRTRLVLRQLLQCIQLSLGNAAREPELGCHRWDKADIWLMLEVVTITVRQSLTMAPGSGHGDGNRSEDSNFICEACNIAVHVLRLLPDRLGCAPKHCLWLLSEHPTFSFNVKVLLTFLRVHDTDVRPAQTAVAKLFFSLATKASSPLELAKAAIALLPSGDSEAVMTYLTNLLLSLIGSGWVAAGLVQDSVILELTLRMLSDESATSLNEGGFGNDATPTHFLGSPAMLFNGVRDHQRHQSTTASPSSADPTNSSGATANAEKSNSAAVEVPGTGVEILAAICNFDAGVAAVCKHPLAGKLVKSVARLASRYPELSRAVLERVSGADEKLALQALAVLTVGAGITDSVVSWVAQGVLQAAASFGPRLGAAWLRHALGVFGGSPGGSGSLVRSALEPCLRNLRELVTPKLAPELRAAGAVRLLMGWLADIFKASPVASDTLPSSSALLQPAWEQHNASDETGQHRLLPSLSACVTGTRVRAIRDFGDVAKGSLGTFVSAGHGVLFDAAPRVVTPFPRTALEPVDAAAGRVFGPQAIVVAHTGHLNLGIVLGEVVSIINTDEHASTSEILTASGKVSVPVDSLLRVMTAEQLQEQLSATQSQLLIAGALIDYTKVSPETVQETIDTLTACIRSGRFTDADSWMLGVLASACGAAATYLLDSNFIGKAASQLSKFAGGSFISAALPWLRFCALASGCQKLCRAMVKSLDIPSLINLSITAGDYTSCDGAPTVGPELIERSQHYLAQFFRNLAAKVPSFAARLSEAKDVRKLPSAVLTALIQQASQSIKIQIRRSAINPTTTPPNVPSSWLSITDTVETTQNVVQLSVPKHLTVKALSDIIFGNGHGSEIVERKVQGLTLRVKGNRYKVGSRVMYRSAGMDGARMWRASVVRAVLATEVWLTLETVSSGTAAEFGGPEARSQAADSTKAEDSAGATELQSLSTFGESLVIVKHEDFNTLLKSYEGGGHVDGLNVVAAAGASAAANRICVDRLARSICAKRHRDHPAPPASAGGWLVGCCTSPVNPKQQQPLCTEIVSFEIGDTGLLQLANDGLLPNQSHPSVLPRSAVGREFVKAGHFAWLIERSRANLRNDTFYDSLERNVDFFPPATGPGNIDYFGESSSDELDEDWSDPQQHAVRMLVSLTGVNRAGWLAWIDRLELYLTIPRFVDFVCASPCLSFFLACCGLEAPETLDGFFFGSGGFRGVATSSTVGSAASNSPNVDVGSSTFRHDVFELLDQELAALFRSEVSLPCCGAGSPVEEVVLSIVARFGKSNDSQGVSSTDSFTSPGQELNAADCAALACVLAPRKNWESSGGPTAPAQAVAVLVPTVAVALARYVPVMLETSIKATSIVEIGKAPKLFSAIFRLVRVLAMTTPALVLKSTIPATLSQLEKKASLLFQRHGAGALPQELLQLVETSNCVRRTADAAAAAEAVKAAENAEAVAEAAAAAAASDTGFDSGSDSDDGDDDEDGAFTSRALAADHHYFNEIAMQGPASRLAISHLSMEYADLGSNLQNSGIRIVVDVEHMTLFKAIIEGPEGTPFEMGLFEFSGFIPPDYPNSPPRLHLETTGAGKARFSPNLYNNGKVCLSLLGTWEGPAESKWQPGTSTLWQVLISIRALIFTERQVDNEPGFTDMAGFKSEMVERGYSMCVRVLTLKYAILQQFEAATPCFAAAVAEHVAGKRDEIIAMIKKELQLLDATPISPDAFGGLTAAHHPELAARYGTDPQRLHQDLSTYMSTLAQLDIV